MARKSSFDMTNPMWLKHFDYNKMQSIYKVKVLIDKPLHSGSVVCMKCEILLYVHDSEGLTLESSNLKHNICREIWNKYQTADFEILSAEHEGYYTVDDWRRDRMTK